ncbi:hypothetical protein Emag_007266 [Eimeria magna]
MNSLKGGEASGAPPMRLSLLCLVLVVFLLPLNQHLFIEASGPSSADLKVSSLTSGSSSSSSRNSSRSRMHQVVAPSGAAAEAQRGSASESSNLVRGFLTATLRGQQLEVNTPLFDGDPRSLATMLDAVLKEAEALGALRVLTAQDAGNSAAFVGHAYAGFLPQDACKVVWMAEASRRRRHQQRLKLSNFAKDMATQPSMRCCLPTPLQFVYLIVGPHGTAVGSELLARLRGMAELDEVAGAVAGDGVEGVSLKGLGVGVTTTLLLTMLILGLVPKRRRHTRTAASNLGMGVMSYEMLLVGQALHNHGGNDVVGVEATLPANGSLKFC